MIKLIDTPDLFIAHLPGTQPYAIISFGGLGMWETGEQKPEFMKTLADAHQDEHLFYVMDRSVSWYNHTYEDCVRYLTQALIDNKIEGVTTLGNSMGGTAAIAIGPALPGFQGALAFSPQVGAASHVVGKFETRWDHHFAAIQNWALPSIEPLLNSGKNTIILGDRSWQDLKHGEIMLRAMNDPSRFVVVRGFGHEAAAALRKTGTLTRLIKHTLRPWAAEQQAADQILAEDGYTLAQGKLPWTARTRFRALRHKLLGAKASTGHRRHAKRLANTSNP